MKQFTGRVDFPGQMLKKSPRAFMSHHSPIDNNSKSPLDTPKLYDILRQTWLFEPVEIYLPHIGNLCILV